MPPGLTLHSDGTVTGTPTTPGTFPVSLQVIDANGITGTVVCSITISMSGGPPTGTCMWLELYVWRQLHTFTSLSEQVQFPPAYQKALQFALAVELASEFRKKARPDVIAIADEARGKIANLNISNDAAKEDPPRQ
jgi:hypothetical protein